MSPTGSTTIAAVIGHPVKHSFSPIIHNAAFAAMGVDWAYGAFEVPAGGGQAAVEAMRTLGLGGLSVTMPLKAEVAAAVDRCSPAAEALGAANCVAWDGDELVGHNTDGQGFVDSLVEGTGKGPEGMTCLVLGAGGAARAVVQALAANGAQSVLVENRTHARAAEAALLAGANGHAVEPGGIADAAAAADLVVNATSVGMGPEGAGQFPLDPALLRADQTIVDLVYHPLRTPLLEAGQSVGASVVEGIGMLIHQAAHQLLLWTGQPAPLPVINDAVAAALRP